MGLDIYVGTLNRYYNRQWETVVQRIGREAGIPVKIIHANQDANEDKASPQEIAETIQFWQREMSANILEVHGPEASEWFRWSEDWQLPYFTDKPAWDCYDALRQFAAHEEYPGFLRRTPYHQDIEKDKAVIKSRMKKRRSRYSQFVNLIEIWIPARFDFYFEAERPSGGRCLFGSSMRLFDQLQDLNQRTWNLSLSSESGDPGIEAGIEMKAQFACQIMTQLAMASVEHRLPMLLNY